MFLFVIWIEGVDGRFQKVATLERPDLKIITQFLLRCPNMNARYSPYNQGERHEKFFIGSHVKQEVE